MSVNQRWIGLEASEAYTRIVADLPEISSTQVCGFDDPPALDHRLELTAEETALYDEAIEFRAQSGLPFWEALMLNLFSRKQETERLLKAALFHQTNRIRNVPFPRDSVSRGALKAIASSVSKPQVVAWISEMWLVDGSKKHLPMLDFHCPVSAENEKLATDAAKTLLGGPFLLLNSGNSYHAIGRRLVELDALIEVLARSLLLSPIIDRGYIAHQLIEKRCALRISKGGHENKVPIVVAAS